MRPRRIRSIVSNPSCLEDGCSEKIYLGLLIMKSLAVSELMIAIS